MRKLKLQMQLSLDGFVAGPNGELDWAAWDWDEELKNYVIRLTEPVDCILMGHNLAKGFIPHWETAAANPDSPDLPFAKIMDETQKVVFSKTLTQSEWKNTVIASGDLESEVTRLKKLPGKDMIVYGGAGFVTNLIEKKLIDELHLFYNPSAIGRGMTIFKDRTALKLMAASSFDCGIVVLTYQPIKQ